MTNSSSTPRRWKRRRVAKHMLCGVILGLMLSSCHLETQAANNRAGNVMVDAGWGTGDPKAGQDLFVSKGCVICHSVNAVGGRAALPLDAPPDGRKVDPMVFAAAMWAGASAMLSLQLTELGYQIGVTGEELRDLAAFASDLKTQSGFSIDDVPGDIRSWIIDAPHWLGDDWPEPFETLPDGLPSPFEDL